MAIVIDLVISCIQIRKRAQFGSCFFNKNFDLGRFREQLDSQIYHIRWRDRVCVRERYLKLFFFKASLYYFL